ncbi:MAG: winged helix DNA-binding domain-containing protein [Actinomycetota bacterium]
MTESPGHLSTGQVLGLRVAAQLLHRPRWLHPAEVVRRLVGVQAQDMFAAPLAIRARTRSATAAGVQGAIDDDRSVVRTWAMRGTLHLLAAEDLPWVVPLVAAPQVAGSLRRLAQLGVPSDTADRAVEAVRRTLDRHGTRTRAELAETLRPMKVPERGQAVIHLIRLAALRGLLCYGPDRSGTPTFVLVRDWLGPASRGPNADAVPAELGMRYLAAHGPAEPRDLAAWSGLGASQARSAWAAIEDRIVEVTTPNGALWTLRSGPRPQRGPVVRLVPAFDPFFLGWRTRQLSLPKRHERKVFPGGGMLRPAVLADGVAVATWTVTRRGDPRTVAISQFGRPEPAVRSAAADDAADVVRFLDPAARVKVDWKRSGDTSTGLP